MAVTERPQQAPRRVEVVAAETADPAIARITAELEGLRSELGDLEVEAHRLELHVAEAEGRTDDGESALPIIERVFADQAVAAQAELREAMEGAVRAANVRLATARAEAETVLADASLTGFDLADDSRWAPSSRIERTRPDPAFQTAAKAPPQSPTEATRAETVATPVTTPDPGWTAATPPVAEMIDPEPRAVAAVLHAEVVAASMPSTASSEPGAFGQFWDAGGEGRGTGERQPTALDAILPLLAVAIVVIVVLSWIG